MNQEEQEIITKNLDFLAKNTNSRAQLLNQLLQQGVISDVENQIIESKEFDYEKNTCLFVTLQKKGNESFSKLLECLNTSGNATIATYLRGSIKPEELLWFDIKAPTKFYNGRDNDVKKIDGCWQESFKNKDFMLVGITGLGGIGKSELARVYAKKFYEEEKGHCVWINAETNQTVLDSFKKLATKIGIPIYNQTGNEKSLENLLPEVYGKLQDEKYLIIFDNLENYEEISVSALVDDAIGRPPTKLKPFVLFTSRYKMVSVSFGHLAKHVELNVLSEEASITFFQNALNVTENFEEIISDVKKLCEKLHYFPLAMQQAAAYINVKKLNSDVATEVKNYVENFDNETKKLLNYRVRRPGLNEDVSRTTYLTWQITLEKVEKITGVGSRASNLLNIIAFLHSDNLDINFIEQILKLMFPDDVTKTQENVDVFDILNLYSMCQKTKKDGRSVLSIHRLVQEVIRIKLDEENQLSDFLDKFVQLVITILEEEIPTNQIIHIQSLWEHTSKIKSMLIKYKKFPDKIARRYYDGGRYREAYSFSCNATSCLEAVFGKDDREVLNMVVWQGETLEKLGEYKQAFKILDDAYQKQKSLFSENDNSCLRTGAIIGVVYWKQGNYQKSLEWMKNTLDKITTIHGEKNTDAFSLKNNLVIVLIHQGDYKEALKQFKETITMGSGVVRNNKRNPIAPGDIAGVRMEQLKFTDALKLANELTGQNSSVIEDNSVLEAINSVEEDELPQTNNEDAGKIMSGLSQIFHSQQAAFTIKIAVASGLKIYEDVRKFQERILETDHPNLLDTKQNIADVKSFQGNYKQALDVYKEILTAREKILGKDHPDTLITKHGIGKAKFQLGEFDNAMKIFKEVLTAREIVLGDKHPETLAIKQEIENFDSEKENIGRPWYFNLKSYARVVADWFVDLKFW